MLGLLALAVVALWAVPALGKDFYVAPLQGTGGAGTIEDPYKLGDLYSLPDPNGLNVLGPALTNLYPGDTLWFRGGAYNLPGWANPNYYWLSVLRPARSGAVGSPIAFRAYPGESVTLSATNGCSVIDNILADTTRGADYIWIDGFTINGPIGYIGGAHPEISYCEVIGSYAPTVDNHDLIFVNQATNLWVHHNILRNQTGDDDHSSGLKLYNSTNGIIEDNYIHHNGTGVQDKEGDRENTFRRNYIVKNQYHGFLGANNGGPNPKRHDFIYENVMDSAVDLLDWGDRTEVHDNLLLSSCLINAWPGQDEYRVMVWNNIVLDDTAATTIAYLNQVARFAPNRIGLFNYNLYTAPPHYQFGEYTPEGKQDFSLSDMRARDHEPRSSVVDTGLDIFVDYTSWELKPQWQRSGRYLDPLGPAPVSVAQIMDTSRYGPRARDRSVPVAGFHATPTSGPAPLAVTFTDTSTNSPTSWEWDFGDDATSTEQHPSHTYPAPGYYTVSLTATNASGADGETKVNYVTVTSSDAATIDLSGPTPRE